MSNRIKEAIRLGRRDAFIVCCVVIFVAAIVFVTNEPKPQTDPVVPGVVTIEQDAEYVDVPDLGAHITIPDPAKIDVNTVYIVDQDLRFIKADGVIITDPDGKVTSWVKNGDK